MGFRTVIIKSRSKLEFRLNSLVVRGDQEQKVFIDEINTLIVQSTAVSLTAALLNELTRRNIKVIFCDEKCNPTAELIPHCGAHNTAKRYREQFEWGRDIKAKVWREIIKKKILEQAALLYEKGFYLQSEMLIEYADEVQENDRTNREGHAAKVYFNCLLGSDCSRQSGGFRNACLNYGYAILLSTFNREIAASGRLTQIGIWHENEFNPFNLACDLMEPFRVAVDRLAFSLEENDKDFKKKMANVLNLNTLIAGKNTTLELAARQYMNSVFHAIEQRDVSLIVFPEKITQDEL